MLDAHWSRGDHQNTYSIDTESSIKIACLLDQNSLITNCMGGVFPERSDCTCIVDVLDIGCGPGGWVHEVAHTYPTMAVTGIDSSALMIEYAYSMAQVRCLSNVHFLVMDALKPLAFPSESFDLVNAHVLFAVMPPPYWPALLQECQRILRPRGVIRLTAGEWGVCTMSAIERQTALLHKAMRLAGCSFSQSGRCMGAIPVMGSLLRKAGFSEIQLKSHVEEIYPGSKNFEDHYLNYQLVFKLVQPLLLKMGVATQAELDQCYEDALVEMCSEDFSSVNFYLTVWGNKSNV